MCSATGGSKKVNSSSKMNEKTSDFGKKDDISKIGGVSSNNETAKKSVLDSKVRVTLVFVTYARISRVLEIYANVTQAKVKTDFNLQAKVFRTCALRFINV
ncbi:hypothetical protein GJ496_006442 [Pomphorhynchus laevis]|nr:hypothetical protein GJ496_006442 [Pomphorhynchus laevis]